MHTFGRFLTERPGGAEQTAANSSTRLSRDGYVALLRHGSCFDALDQHVIQLHAKDWLQCLHPPV